MQGLRSHTKDASSVIQFCFHLLSLRERERERERLRKWHFQMNIPVEFLDEFDLGVAARNFGRGENNSQL